MMMDRPHNFEAEQAVLGAVLYNNAAYHRVSEIAKAEHFADPLHGRLFESFATLIDRGLVVSAVTLKAYAEQDPDLKAVGGPRYLARLVAASATVDQATAYAETVRDLYLRRRLMDVAEHTRLSAASPDGDAQSKIAQAESELYEIASADRPSGGFRTAADALRGAIDQADVAYQGGGRLVGVSTGLRSLDSFLGGLHRSDLIILAGRPSMGKTALATNIAFNAARLQDQDRENGATVGFFSLEMSSEQLMLRGLAEAVRVPAEAIRQGRINNSQMDEIHCAEEALGRLPIHINDKADLTVAEIRTQARRLKRKHGLGLVIVDYLQLIEGATKSNPNRVQQVSEISRGLKTLAKELDVPVLALSQLSRAVETRPDKRPQLADLRESGSIEQDADVVMFVYREEYYLERGDKKNSPEHIASMGLAEVIVAKHRHGRTGTLHLGFDGALTKFSDRFAEEDHR